jgi:hypothetical protein
MGVSTIGPPKSIVSPYGGWAWGLTHGAVLGSGRKTQDAGPGLGTGHQPCAAAAATEMRLGEWVGGSGLA